MAEQLIFDLPVRASHERGDFFVSDANGLAVARLETPETWPGGKLVLVGPEGAGKTHLAHVWAEREGAHVVAGDGIAGVDIGSMDRALAVDDADRLSDEAERMLFHLHNHLGALGLPLLMTARAAPSRWSIVLPDLKSRLEAAEVARIDTPDDALLTAVLMKLFADRQTGVTPSAIAWLIRHMDRSFAEAQRLVAAIDARALAERRSVTRDLVAEVLDNTPGAGP